VDLEQQVEQQEAGTVEVQDKLIKVVEVLPT
jgi:hypothetical protein